VADVGQDELGAAPGQLERDRPPDPSPAARDQR
jgi:hypothetical protein